MAVQILKSQGPGWVAADAGEKIGIVAKRTKGHCRVGGRSAGTDCLVPCLYLQIWRRVGVDDIENIDAGKSDKEPSCHDCVRELHEVN